MKDVGIKVWVLTGDKIETAINIGYSAGLLNDDMPQHIIDELDVQQLVVSLSEKQKEIEISNKAERDAQELKEKLEWETEQKIELERRRRIAAEKVAQEESEKIQKEQ